MPKLTVRHETVYRYSQPVQFGPHRLMFRPRDSHDMRLIDTRLEIDPGAEVSWMHDVFSNSITIAHFPETADTLRFVSTIELDHYGLSNPAFPIEPFAQTYPFSYRFEQQPDLARMIERHHPDVDRRVDQWARRFLNAAGPTDTQEMLVNITRAIKEEFTYVSRTEPGTQTPLETLQLGSGTCRDYALFMMEVARSFGLAARFVSGYLYDPALDGADEGFLGAGATHAWVQIYLPGAGWVEFDPTNGLVGGANLIRIAVARDPAQAIPLSGSFIGPPGSFERMEVDVKVVRGGISDLERMLEEECAAAERSAENMPNTPLNSNFQQMALNNGCIETGSGHNQEMFANPEAGAPVLLGDFLGNSTAPNEGCACATPQPNQIQGLRAAVGKESHPSSYGK
ncbi:MAG: transglutaminase family protein [Pseudomonadota bacterium]